MIKKLFFILAIVLAAQSANAQLFSKERLANLETFDNRFLTYGYFLGFNSYDFKIEYINQAQDDNTDIIVNSQSGFNVGLVGDMRINKYINLRLEPGLYFAQRNLTFPNLEEERDFLREVNDYGASRLIYTDINRDGMKQSPNFEETSKIANISNCPVIISGGVSSIDDIKKAKSLNKNIEGIIVGKSIYDGDIKLEELMKEIDA